MESWTPNLVETRWWLNSCVSSPVSPQVALSESSAKKGGARRLWLAGAEASGGKLF